MAPIDIVTGYRPGLIGQMVSLHAAYYSQTLGFGQPFESRVATGLAEFAGRFSAGFALAAEYDDQSWGRPVREMRLERPHPLRSTDPAGDRAPPP